MLLVARLGCSRRSRVTACLAAPLRSERNNVCVGSKAPVATKQLACKHQRLKCSHHVTFLDLAASRCMRCTHRSSMHMAHARPAAFLARLTDRQLRILYLCVKRNPCTFCRQGSRRAPGLRARTICLCSLWAVD